MNNEKFIIDILFEKSMQIEDLKSFGISESIIEKLKSLGFVSLTPVQEEAIKKGLFEGKSLVARAQVIDHIDGNPQNNNENNLQTICQMCNLIKHAGQGCVVKGVVDLYKESKYNQNDIIRITREMRDRGKTDEEIIHFLGLKHKMVFKMDKRYLRRLYGFVTSRSTRTGNDMYDRWKAYHISVIRKVRGDA